MQRLDVGRRSYLPLCQFNLPGRVIDAAPFPQTSFLERPFHQFVAEQSKDPTTHKKRSGIAIPINTRRAAVIVDC